MITIPDHIQGLIFDLDGTLADTMSLHFEAWHETFADLGISCPQSFLDTIHGIPGYEVVAMFNRRFGHSVDVEWFCKTKHARFRDKLPRTRGLTPVVEVVHRYHGQLPMAVASGGIRQNVVLTLEAISLDDYFETILTADDPIPGKPNPDLFLEAARRLGVAPKNCLVFEDGDPGLDAARAGGMPYIDVRPYLTESAVS